MTDGTQGPRHSQPASRFCAGPVIPGHQVQADDLHHVWIIDQVLVPCSVAEYRCLKLLLESVDRCVPLAALAACFADMATLDPKQERLRLVHLMSALRARLWPLGFDLGSVMAIGYILLSGTSAETAEPSLAPEQEEGGEEHQHASRKAGKQP